MSNMIERVALAISLGEWSEGDSYAERQERETWLVRARAAVEAMREPTKEMVEPGYQAIHDSVDFYNYDSGAGYTVEPFGSADVWRAMITAALPPIAPDGKPDSEGAPQIKS